MAAAAKRASGDTEDVVCGFIHGVTETRVSMRGSYKLFNAVIQVSRDDFHDVVVFAPEKRTSFVQAEKNKSPVKLARIKRRVGSDGSRFDVQCGKTTEISVVSSLPFSNKQPPEKSKRTVAETEAMAPRQHVSSMDVRVVHVSVQTETVEVNGVLSETQACYIEDSSGVIKLQVWEALIGKLVYGCCYTMTNLNTREFGGKAYLTTTWNTQIVDIVAVAGLKSEIDFVVDEEEVTTIVSKMCAAEVKISHKCVRCQAWQQGFDGKSRFQRCKRCNKLQNTESFQPTVTTRVNVTGYSEDMTLSNSVMKRYLTKENLLNLLVDHQDLEEHLMVTSKFKIKVRNNNIVELSIVAGETSAAVV